VEETRSGGPAAEDREHFHDVQPGTRAEIFENFLGSFLNNFTLTGASIGALDNVTGNLTRNYKFAVQGYAQNAGGLLTVGRGSSAKRDRSFWRASRANIRSSSRRRLRSDAFEDYTAAGLCGGRVAAADKRGMGVRWVQK
jgi:hypothetical protein